MGYRSGASRATLLTAVTATVALIASAVGVVALATPASADPYPAQSRTTCTIDAPSSVVRGNDVTAVVNVLSNSLNAVTGEVTLSLRSLAGRAVFTETVPFAGEPVSIRTGRFDRLGNHRMRLVFESTDGTVRGCAAESDLQVARALSPNSPGTTNPGSTNPGTDGGTIQSGVLPDTGGPALLWLLLGLASVVLGGGAVVLARREGSSAGGF